MAADEAGSAAKGRPMSRDQWTVIGVGVALLGSLAYFHSDLGDRIDNVRSDLSAQIGEMRGTIGEMRERLASVETRFDGVETRLGGVETRLDGVETRLVRIEDAVGVPALAEAAEPDPALARVR